MPNAGIPNKKREEYTKGCISPTPFVDNKVKEEEV
jgi:hypothetical protein